MLERKIKKEIISWKTNHKNSCLLITGARQIGKTFIIDEFAAENYHNIIKLDFIKYPEQMEIFSGNLDVDTIIKRMSVMISDFKIVEGDTLIFLDEIQVCENAITALKFLAMDTRFDVIATGSMLGIAYKRSKSFPVGYIERIKMYSLDFEEFCWANGMSKDAIAYLKEFFDNRREIPDAIHNKMLELFKEYIIVGGMPRVVDEFITSKNFNNVLKIQSNIINDYKDDIIKYADEQEKTKVRLCFDSIPNQLAKENKKFKYNLVDKKGTFEKFASSLRWLDDAGITNFCYNLSLPESPLEGNKINENFKIYMKDTGLLMAMYESGSQKEIISGNLGIYKGAIYENIIADILGKKNMELYYFEHNSTLEIDFIIRYNEKVTALEVKSGDNTKSKSLQSVMNNWSVPQGIRLSTKNIGVNQNGILSIPLYMAMFL